MKRGLIKLLWIAGFVVVAFGVGIVIAPLVSDNRQPIETATKSAPPPIKVSAETLSREYQQNELRADRNYKGEPLEITGTVSGIGRETLGRPYLILNGDVQAVFDPTWERTLASVSKGDRVTVQCIGVGKLVFVQTRACSLGR